MLTSTLQSIMGGCNRSGQCQGNQRSICSSSACGCSFQGQMSVKAVLRISAISLNYYHCRPLESVSQSSKRLLIMSMASVMACLLGRSSSRMVNIYYCVREPSASVSQSRKVCSNYCSNYCYSVRMSGVYWEREGVREKRRINRRGIVRRSIGLRVAYKLLSMFGLGLGRERQLRRKGQQNGISFTNLGLTIAN